MPLRAGDRTEPLRDPFVAVLSAIRERDHDEVAFITLHVFKVLDKERLGASPARAPVARAEVSFDRLVASGPIEFLADGIPLLDIDRHYTERRNIFFRQVGVSDHEIDRGFDDTSDLGGIPARLVIPVAWHSSSPIALTSSYRAGGVVATVCWTHRAGAGPGAVSPKG